MMSITHHPFHLSLFFPPSPFFLASDGTRISNLQDLQGVDVQSFFLPCIRMDWLVPALAIVHRLPWVPLSHLTDP